MKSRLGQALDVLADVIEQENQALEAVDFAKAATLLPAKQSASAAFLSALADSRQPAPTMEPFLALLSENSRRLQQAMKVQARVVDCIAAAIPTETLAPRYGSAGGSYSQKAAPRALSSRV
jgi:hypothetical protein